MGYNAFASFSFQTNRSDSTSLGCNKWEFENSKMGASIFFRYKRQQQ